MKHRSFPSNKQKEVQPIASKSHKDAFIRTERFQFSCGRVSGWFLCFRNRELNPRRTS